MSFVGAVSVTMSNVVFVMFSIHNFPGGWLSGVIKTFDGFEIREWYTVTLVELALIVAIPLFLRSLLLVIYTTESL